MSLDHVPHEPIIYLGISMNQDVSESDQFPVVAYSTRRLGIERCHLPDRLADYFKLPLNSSSKHGVREVVIYSLAADEIAQSPCGLFDVVDVLAYLKPHITVRGRR